MRKNSLIRKIFLVPEVSILFSLVFLIILFYSLNNIFLSFPNIANILRSFSYYAIIGVGVTFCLISGQIDISVGSVAGLAAVSSGLLLRNGFPIFFALLMGLLVGVTIGFINGIITVKAKIPSLLTTLGMMNIARGLVYVTTKGYNVYPFPESFNQFGAADPLGISYSFVACMIIIFIAVIILRGTIWGRRVYAVGGNERSSKIAGINADRLVISVLILSSLLASVSGIFLSARIASAHPTIGLGWELRVLTAVIIGGVSVRGGVGSVIGPVIGAALIATLDSGMILANISPYWQTTVVGCILISAVIVDTLRRKVIA